MTIAEWNGKGNTERESSGDKYIIPLSIPSHGKIQVNECPA
jgi:hypothetical protein